MISTPLHIGDSIIMTIYFPDKVSKLKLFYHGMEVNTLFGTQICYCYKPEAKVGRFFKSEDVITFWFSADESYIPVRVHMNLVIGAITDHMTEYKNGN